MQNAALASVEPDSAMEGAANCKALGQILDRIGDKWTVMVGGLETVGFWQEPLESGPPVP